MSSCRIHFKEDIIECQNGDNLLEVMQSENLQVYNGRAKLFNCRGLGTCGTCAVRILGKVSEPTDMEKMRLSLPPHKLENGLRLACQCKVEGDIEVIKYQGFWGQTAE